MKIEKFKEFIEKGLIPDELLIFKYSDTDFIAHQYIQEILKLRKAELKIIENFETLPDLNNPFFESDNSYKYLFTTDSLEYIINCKDLIIICKDISPEISKKYKDNIISIPKLVDWQIKDYVLGKLNFLSEDEADWLIKSCNNNMNQIDSEIKKFNGIENKKYVYNLCLRDHQFSHLSSYDLFSLVNCFTKKDISSFCKIYTELTYEGSSANLDPMALVGILKNSFIKILRIKTGRDISSTELGISDKQLWFYRNKICPLFQTKELISIIKTLIGFNHNLIIGALPEKEDQMDYLIVKIFGAY